MDRGSMRACLRKNNNRKAYQLLKDLTTEKQGKSKTIKDTSELPQRGAKNP